MLASCESDNVIFCFIYGKKFLLPNFLKHDLPPRNLCNNNNNNHFCPSWYFEVFKRRRKTSGIDKGIDAVCPVDKVHNVSADTRMVDRSSPVTGRIKGGRIALLDWSLDSFLLDKEATRRYIIFGKRQQIFSPADFLCLVSFNKFELIEMN